MLCIWFRSMLAYSFSRTLYACNEFTINYNIASSSTIHQKFSENNIGMGNGRDIRNCVKRCSHKQFN